MAPAAYGVGGSFSVTNSRIVVTNWTATALTGEFYANTTFVVDRAELESPSLYFSDADVTFGVRRLRLTQSRVFKYAYGRICFAQTLLVTRLSLLHCENSRFHVTGDISSGPVPWFPPGVSDWKFYRSELLFDGTISLGGSSSTAIQNSTVAFLHPVNVNMFANFKLEMGAVVSFRNRFTLDSGSTYIDSGSFLRIEGEFITQNCPDALELGYYLPCHIVRSCTARWPLLFNPLTRTLPVADNRRWFPSHLGPTRLCYVGACHRIYFGVLSI